MGRTIATSTQYGIRLRGTDSPATVLAGVTVNSSGTSAYGLYGSSPSPVSVSNLGDVRGSKVGILLDHAGSIINGSAGGAAATISGATGIEASNAGVTVRNLASIEGGTGVYLVHGGRVTNGSAADHSATLYGYVTGVAMGGHGSVANNATIISSYAGSWGVSLAAGGSVSNGLAYASALIYGGYGYGVVIDGGTGVVANGGTIADTSARYSGYALPGHYLFGTAVLMGAGGILMNGMDGHTAATIQGTYVGIAIAGGTGDVRNGGTILGMARSYYVSGPVGVFATFGVGVTLADGGRVANGSVTDPGALIEGGRYGVILSGPAGTVMNEATIASIGENKGYSEAGRSQLYFGDGVMLSAGGTVINGLATQATGALITSKNVGIDIAAGSGLVSNDGTVLATNATYFDYKTFEYGTGIVLQAGGRVINGSPIVTGALIRANAAGVQIAGGYGTVANDGTILAAGAPAVFYGMTYFQGGIGVAASVGGRISNGIAGVRSALISGVAFGVSVSGGPGVVTNAGTIASAGIGVALYGASSTVLNSGLITGDIGIRVTGASATITNVGTISGSQGAAVMEAASNILQIGAGAVFDGDVLAGGTHDILRLLAGAPGTLGELGTAFAGFNDLYVAKSAAWSLARSNNGGLEFGVHIGNLARLDVTGSFAVGSMLTLQGPGALDVAATGQLVIGYGTTGTIGQITIDSYGGTIIGSGTIGSGIVDNGDALAYGGTLVLEGDVAGRGTVGISARSVLQANSELASAHIQFLTGVGETLALGSPSLVTSVIAGFSIGDRIDLLGTVATSLSFASATDILTVRGTGGVIAALHFAGSYTPDRFQLGPDGHGGSVISLH